MRAIICREWGEPSVLKLEDVAPPTAGPGQVLLNVKAASVNFADIVMVQGNYQTKPSFPFAPGLEGAGTVAAVGAGVTGFAVGDRVLAKLAYGGFADQAVARAQDCHSVPQGMPWDVAGSFYVAYVSSHVALRWQGEVQAGQTLLVLGASGGTGLTAVEIGKAMGATVIAGASSADKLEVAKAHGADHGINYGDEDLKARIADLTKGEGIDVVFDPVGGDLFDPALSSLGWGGRYLIFGFVGGIPKIPANRLLVKHRSAMGCSLRYFTDKAPEKLAISMAELFAMYAAGKIKPLVSETYPLEQAVEAMETLRQRKATGRVVVTVS
ncbi:MAG: NADPH:quinone oxidoreductase family protein [Proteobacteria bacterium]|nr:NADPH:quinone oxidoreductase family protein [Pseudomonadota bacterium]MDA1058396.1 NADPH:quinone oxidoreductase family protein [Pseudomonadota bacterium]